MGLDMYAFSVAQKDALGDFEVTPYEDEGRDVEEIAYWRKFNALHGWMEELYREKGGTDTFNCVKLRLTEQDLIALNKTIADGMLKPTEGFFFGTQEVYPEDVQDALKFIGTAMAEIARGRVVYYDSWW